MLQVNNVPPQKPGANPELESIELTISVKTLLFLSGTPFCYSV